MTAQYLDVKIFWRLVTCVGIRSVSRYRPQRVGQLRFLLEPGVNGLISDRGPRQKVSHDLGAFTEFFDCCTHDMEFINLQKQGMSCA